MMRKRGKWIALAAAAASAIVLGFTACSDGDDYSDVGPAPTPKPPKKEGTADTSELEEQIAALRKQIAELETGSGDSGVSFSSIIVKPDTGDKAYGADGKALTKTAKTTADNDSFALEAGGWVWAAGGGNLTVTVPMPSAWDSVTVVGLAGATSGGAAAGDLLVDVEGTEVASATVDATTDPTKIVMTFPSTSVGDQLYLMGYGIKASDSSKVSFVWPVPVTKAPTAIDLSAANTGKVQVTVGAGGSAADIADDTGKEGGIRTLGDCSANGFVDTAYDPEDGITSATAHSLYLDAGKVTSPKLTPALTVANVLGTFSTHAFAAAQRPGTVEYGVYEATDATHAAKIGTMTIEVKVNGKVKVTGKNGVTNLTLVPKFTDAAKLGTFDGATAATLNGTIADADKEKTMWLGKAGTGSDVEITFSVKESGYTTYAWSAAGDGAAFTGGTTIGASNGKLDLKAAETKNPVVTCLATKADGSVGRGTYTIKVAKWPTAPVTISSTNLQVDTGAGAGNMTNGPTLVTGGALKAWAEAPTTAKDVAFKPVAAADADVVAFSMVSTTFTTTIKKAGTALYKVYQAAGTLSSPAVAGDWGDPLGIVTITVDKDSTVSVDGPTAMTAGDITATVGTTAIIDGDASATTYNATKHVWLGKAGTPDDAVLTFATAAGYTNPEWYVSGATGANTKFGAAADANKLTIDGKSDDGNTPPVYTGEETGTLTVTCFASKTVSGVTTQYKGTFDVLAVKWPTLEIGVVTTAYSAGGDTVFNGGSATADADIDGTPNASNCAVGKLYYRTNHHGTSAKSGKWVAFDAMGSGGAGVKWAATAEASSAALSVAASANTTDPVIWTASGAGTAPVITINGVLVSGSAAVIKIQDEDKAATDAASSKLTVYVDADGTVHATGAAGN